jgi:hypothetical protein
MPVTRLASDNTLKYYTYFYLINETLPEEDFLIPSQFT